VSRVSRGSVYVKTENTLTNLFVLHSQFVDEICHPIYLCVFFLSDTSLPTMDSNIDENCSIFVKTDKIGLILFLRFTENRSVIIQKK
jgi:hypothetical protein